MAMLEVDVTHTQGGFSLDLAFSAAGPVTALFGPSGAGKSTLVNLIAGLEQPARARITLGGDILIDTQRGISLPPEKRNLGYVFQEARLFPHMTVAANIRYGLGSHRNPPQGADHILSVLNLGHLMQRRPATLSGGEQKRVAIARALFRSPSLLLMDEPLANLDPLRRAEILAMIERLAAEDLTHIVYVSHIVAEVSRLADDVAVLDHGRLVAMGPAVEVVNEPAITGAGSPGDERGSVIEGYVETAAPAGGFASIAIGKETLNLDLGEMSVGSRIRLFVRARDVTLALERVSGVSIQNQLPGVIEQIDPLGPNHRLVTVRLAGAGGLVRANITAKAERDLGLSPGTRIWTLIKTAALAAT